MQLDALEPFVQQFQQSLIGGCCHVFAAPSLTLNEPPPDG
jgi:hypothetical protein